MPYLPITDEDKKTLQELNLRLRKLNDYVASAHEDGYEIELRVEDTKPGYPRIRLVLKRQVGT